MPTLPPLTQMPLVSVVSGNRVVSHISITQSIVSQGRAGLFSTNYSQYSLAAQHLSWLSVSLHATVPVAAHHTQARNAVVTGSTCFTTEHTTHVWKLSHRRA